MTGSWNARLWRFWWREWPCSSLRLRDLYEDGFKEGECGRSGCSYRRSRPQFRSSWLRKGADRRTFRRGQSGAGGMMLTGAFVSMLAAHAAQCLGGLVAGVGAEHCSG